jgi:uncharacterized protein YxjI
MNPVLQKNNFLIKEQIGAFRASNNYDIYDPETNEILMKCSEPYLGIITKFLRFTEYYIMTPFHIEVRTADGQPVLTVERGILFFLSKVKVFDENYELIGFLKQKFFSFRGSFDVLDANGNVIFTLKGTLVGWNFGFFKKELKIAHISKKWAGISKELFTSADNYVLNINNIVAADDSVRILILAAVMCIDMVLKE